MTNKGLSILSIISISYDESLLRTREWILKAAGFKVTSALGFTEASAYCLDSGFDLVIIGHSLPTKDKAAPIEHIRRHNHTRILSLRRPTEETLPRVDHSIDSWSPDNLVAAVKAVLDEKRA